MVSLISNEQQEILSINVDDGPMMGKLPAPDGAGQAIQNDDDTGCAQIDESSYQLEVITTTHTPNESPTSVTKSSPQQEPVQYVDERTKVLGRRAELERLRKRNSLQEKKAAFNSHSPLSTSLASFFLQQKQMKNEVRKNRLGALNSLSRYRLKDSDGIMAAPRTPKRGGGGYSRFGLGSSMPSAYSCMVDIDDFFRKQKQSDMEWREEKESTLKKLHMYRQQQTDYVCSSNDRTGAHEPASAVEEGVVSSDDHVNKGPINETPEASVKAGTTINKDDEIFESLLMCRMMIHAELVEFFTELSTPSKVSDNNIQDEAPSRDGVGIQHVRRSLQSKHTDEKPKVEPDTPINNSELLQSDAANLDKAPENAILSMPTQPYNDAIVQESHGEDIPEQLQEDDMGIDQCCRCEILDALLSPTTSTPEECDEDPAIQYRKGEVDKKQNGMIDPPPDLKVVGSQVQVAHQGLSQTMSSDELQAPREQETPFYGVERQTDLASTDNSQDTGREPVSGFAYDVTFEKKEMEVDDKSPGKDDAPQLEMEITNDNQEQENLIEQPTAATMVDKAEDVGGCEESSETGDSKGEKLHEEARDSQEDSSVLVKKENDVVRNSLAGMSDLKLLADANVNDEDTHVLDHANNIMVDLDAGEEKKEERAEPCLASSILDPFSEARPSFDNNSDRDETYGSSTSGKKSCPLGLQEGSMSLEEFVASGAVSSPMPTVDSSVSSMGSSIEERTGDVGGLSRQSSVSSLSSFWQERCVPMEKYNKAALMCNEEQYLPNLHSTKGPCERCFSLASAKEKAKFRTSGRCLHIMVVRGGCHRKCNAFPRRKDEPPVRLCRKCYFDTHRAAKGR